MTGSSAPEALEFAGSDLCRGDLREAVNVQLHRGSHARDQIVDGE